MASTANVHGVVEDLRAAAAERDRGSLAAHAGLTTLCLGLVAEGSWARSAGAGTSPSASPTRTCC
jgi:hypothetical protein